MQVRGALGRNTTDTDRSSVSTRPIPQAEHNHESDRIRRTGHRDGGPSGNPAFVELRGAPLVIIDSERLDYLSLTVEQASRSALSSHGDDERATSVCAPGGEAPDVRRVDISDEDRSAPKTPMRARLSRGGSAFARQYP